MYKGEDEDVTKLLSRVYEEAPRKADVRDLRDSPCILGWGPVDTGYVDGWVSCFNKLHPDEDLWRVNLYSASGSIALLMRDPQAFRAIVEKFDAAQQERLRNRKPTPEKVVAKMISLRLRRVRDFCARQQGQISRVQKDQENNAKRLETEGKIDIATNVRKSIPDDLPAVNLVHCDKAEYIGWLNALKEHPYGRPYDKAPKAAIKELRLYLEQRPDFTEEVFRMSCDLAIIEEIHES